MGLPHTGVATVWVPGEIYWLEECVTTATFSICLIGNLTVSFKGREDLRQGDPMSPYLFVLVMEVLRGILQQMIANDPLFRFHWKCAELGLFQLGFADDLLLFCAVERHSIALCQRGLALFASLSGLQVNPAKSQLILSKAAHTERTQFIQILGFQEGVLPVRYLGLPLISSRLSLTDCRPLLQKIDDRIQGWVGTHCLFAARAQLIKSVLMALNTYWAMALFCQRGSFEKLRRGCGPFCGKEQRDLGMLRLPGHEFARQLRKEAWEFAICLSGSVRERTVWTASLTSGSWSWRKLLRLRTVLLPRMTFRIGDGTRFSLWHDPWHHLGPLITRFPLGPNVT
ncbi:UNVERIFIED_CONTAM: LINE-1 retrotransposable element O protein, partial [Sesamum latifolium]